MRLTRWMLICLLAFLSVACKAPRNSVILQSDAGDYIGAGQEYAYSNKNAVISVVADGALLTVRVDGDESWRGDFQLPDGYTELQPGSYPALTRYPFHDAAIGGLSWDGEGRGCNTLEGWLVIDRVVYTDAGLSELQLRFEQHCGSNVAALHGTIKWYASDKSVPPGPVNPVPADAWQPPADAIPAVGDAVYLISEPGDYIGAGAEYVYGADTTPMTVSEANGFVTINIDGWYGRFAVMNTLQAMAPGYYGDLMRYPFHNPTKGGLSWSGNGRGCNRLSGWFAVDDVAYVEGELDALTLRFEQHCEEGDPALNGFVRWQR